jgi:hypothetical protein
MTTPLLSPLGSAFAGLVLVATLTGCPATWGFQASVRALPQGASSGVLAPVADAKIVCDGCTLPVYSGPPGEFTVDLGTTYSKPGPVVLHVTAPHYRPLDVTINHSFYLASSNGPSSLTFVLEPADAPLTDRAPAAPPSAAAAGSSP